ncbi:hypothetical protein MKW94_013873 [Papaver nudicaule]|uniref:Transmembrane protein n=1 Tax=Papaver nudicaule TaxID=74823 RepID=A0AA42B5C9_PAPNU|nr:hypothetical protein [Papaver nudicaule]MCL7052020.1 hypothetical protein [Papaver nudicaule]
MEGVTQGLKFIAKDYSTSAKSSSPYTTSSGFSNDQAHIVIRRNSSQMVSVWTCSKLCAVGFVVGVFVGFTLKKRVRKWASKVLRRLRDD